MPRTWLGFFVTAVLSTAMVWVGLLETFASGKDGGPGGFRPERVEVAGMQNVFRLTDRLYSGGSPEGDAGFAALAKLGIKTIISVDGARPDVELARKHRLRYVHLPIGYDGVHEEQALKIARAVRDLPGPIYLHCHHGKHRAPAAAAMVVLCLDRQCPVTAVVDYMKRAGTDPHYTGLYESPEKLKRPTTEALDRAPADFPETAKIAALARMMVQIDAHWDRMLLVKQAGWKRPKGHPDIDPPHEALQLRELLNECGRLRETTAKYPDDIRKIFADADSSVRALEEALRTKLKPTDVGVAEKAYQRVVTSCTQCHARYRNAPRAAAP
jgi:protein tyrosine phosphatase (PTP) superfamily phosphohydrolase (DUF442 family)